MLETKSNHKHIKWRQLYITWKMLKLFSPSYSHTLYNCTRNVAMLRQDICASLADPFPLQIHGHPGDKSWHIQRPVVGVGKFYTQEQDRLSWVSWWTILGFVWSQWHIFPTWSSSLPTFCYIFLEQFHKKTLLCCHGQPSDSYVVILYFNAFCSFSSSLRSA